MTRISLEQGVWII